MGVSNLVPSSLSSNLKAIEIVIIFTIDLHIHIKNHFLVINSKVLNALIFGE